MWSLWTDLQWRAGSCLSKWCCSQTWMEEWSLTYDCPTKQLLFTSVLSRHIDASEHVMFIFKPMLLWFWTVLSFSWEHHIPPLPYVSIGWPRHSVSQYFWWLKLQKGQALLNCFWSWKPKLFFPIEGTGVWDKNCGPQQPCLCALPSATPALCFYHKLGWLIFGFWEHQLGHRTNLPKYPVNQPLLAVPLVCPTNA